MKILTKTKQFFLNAFRELFIYHHSSLEFRAKLFATVIIADDTIHECYYEKVAIIAAIIYKDSSRIETLKLTTIEYVNKAKRDNGLGIDELFYDIIESVKLSPKYAKKIDKNQLDIFLECTKDKDTLSYQENIIQFLSNLRADSESRS